MANVEQLERMWNQNTPLPDIAAALNMSLGHTRKMLRKLGHNPAHRAYYNKTIQYRENLAKTYRWLYMTPGVVWTDAALAKHLNCSSHQSYRYRSLALKMHRFWRKHNLHDVAPEFLHGFVTEYVMAEKGF